MIVRMVARAASTTARTKTRAIAITKHIVLHGPLRRARIARVPPLGKLLLVVLSLLMLMLMLAILALLPLVLTVLLILRSAAVSTAATAATDWTIPVSSAIVAEHVVLKMPIGIPGIAGIAPLGPRPVAGVDLRRPLLLGMAPADHGCDLVLRPALAFGRGAAVLRAPVQFARRLLRRRIHRRPFGGHGIGIHRGRWWYSSSSSSSRLSWWKRRLSWCRHRHRHQRSCHRRRSRRRRRTRHCCPDGDRRRHMVLDRLGEVERRR
mmetsp:Transcript_16379/g.47034  ORF Transcript_16379/g.47034 Transcript_16379/m.47034 type:complete len:264 (-) Transcript_16379:823-1614(-)